MTDELTIWARGPLRRRDLKAERLRERKQLKIVMAMALVAIILLIVL